VFLPCARTALDAAARAWHPNAVLEPTVRRVAHVAVVLAIALGCAALRPPLTAPDKGGPPWVARTSPNFVLETDVDHHSADALIADFERTYAALAHVTQTPESSSSDRIELVVFERDVDFQETFGHDRTKKAYFTPKLPADFDYHPIMVMSQDLLTVETRTTFLHELTHLFLRRRLPRIPLWLNEGLAQYYSTLRIEGDRVVLGDDLPNAVFWKQPFYSRAWHGDTFQVLVPAYKAARIRELVDAEVEGFNPSSEHVSTEARTQMHLLYLTSWRLVHWLMNGAEAPIRARFRAYWSELGRGTNAREAFRQAFGDDLSYLEESFRPYLTADGVGRSVVPFPAKTGPDAPQSNERPMSGDEVRALWDRLSSIRKKSESRYPIVK
jgi:hypothetical protein